MCLTFEDDYQNCDSFRFKNENTNRAFDLKGHLAVKSVLESTDFSRETETFG